MFKKFSDVILIVIVLVHINIVVSNSNSADGIIYNSEEDDNYGNKQVNDLCRTTTRAPGICKYVTDCQVVFNMIFHQGNRNYVRCGFDNTKQIVCCPLDSITSTTPTTTSTTTTTTISPPIITTPPNRSDLPDHDCINKETNEKGFIKFARYCPELGGDFSVNVDENLCNYENYALCYDIVCCPIRNSNRLKQKCRFFDDPDNEMKLRSNLNFECDTPIANGVKSFYSTECQLTNQTRVIISDTSQVQPQCCPITSIKKFEQWDSPEFKYVKVQGRNCTSSRMPNVKGTCRPHNQCPSERVIDQNACYTNRETLFVCCEDETPTGPAPFEEACFKYSQEVYSERYDLVVEPIDYRMRTGFNFDPLLTLGIIAKPTEYPHMVALGYKITTSEIEFSCSGSLISNKFVLTVAQCLYIYDLITAQQVPAVKVRVGITTLNMLLNTNDCPEDYDVEQLIPYPDFDRDKYYNDIGLIKLKQTVLITPYVRPICLPTTDMIPPEVISLGYGAVSDINPTHDKLVKILLDTYTTDECKMYFSHPLKKLNNGIDPTKQVCAGSRLLLLNACPADSGGSIITPHNQFYETNVLIGLTTYSKMCGFINIPGIYTLVYPYRDWIQNIVWNNS